MTTKAKKIKIAALVVSAAVAAVGALFAFLRRR